MPPTKTDLIRAMLTRLLNEKGYDANDQGTHIQLRHGDAKFRITVDKED